MKNTTAEILELLELEHEDDIATLKRLQTLDITDKESVELIQHLEESIAIRTNELAIELLGKIKVSRNADAKELIYELIHLLKLQYIMQLQDIYRYYL